MAPICQDCGRKATHAVLVPFTFRDGSWGQEWQAINRSCEPTAEDWIIVRLLPMVGS